MTRRTLLKGLGGGGVLQALPRKLARPNILFLFTDDQRADTIQTLGNRAIRTPNIDRIASSGYTFRNNFCMGGNSGAVCLPSRNMLLSGRAYFRFDTYASGSDPNFPDSLRQGGYFTYHHGKRGNVAREIHKRFDVSRYTNDEPERLSGEPGKEIADQAISFLKQRTDTRPLFMYLAFGNPHDPRVAARRYRSLYRIPDIPLPKNYMPVHPFDNGEMVIRDELLAPWPRTREEIQKQLLDYYATITALDLHIGRILDALDRSRQLENTLIIFSSDNGLALGSHGLMGKQNLYEHGMKVPLIFSGPGIPHGESGALTYLLDIYPTVLDLLGLPQPAGLDGMSLSPVIDGKAPGVRDTLFTSYRDVQRAIRDQRWKLIVYPKINKRQLFDLQVDPDELHDLSADPRQASRIETMYNQMRAWQRRLGDKAPLESPNPADPSFTPPTGAAFEELKKRWKM